MTRAELIEALEVERFTLPPRRDVTTAELRGWTPEQQAEHRAVLLDAIDGTEAAVLPLRRKGAA